MDNSLRELQLCELGILKEVKRVCEKNQLSYYLNSGTLLGAVRHKGFIPWDDDIDIMMPYHDYKRFAQIAQEQLDSGFFFQDHHSDPAFSGLFSKVRKDNTTMLSVYERGRAGHHGVWIDIFPIISVYGKFDFRVRKLGVKICNYIMMDKSHFDGDTEWIRSQTNGFMFGIVKLLRKSPERFRRAVYRLFERVVFMGQKKKTRFKGVVWTSLTKMYPSELFEGEPESLLFEDEQFSAPPGYDEFLTITYGDYMTPPPEDKRNGGHGEVIIDLENSWEQYNIRE